jgi:hypothetical protein
MNWLYENIEMVTVATLLALPLLILGGCLWLCLGLDDVEKDKQ